ncbi:hypothetical protein PENNAL_c0037G09168 [Penicillium nalgiovense]|uniref:CCHC-type domain-containing protein n=1 Tax=Penicillium nalgiovense TaxID=60175 RepID=A0A1V6Y4H9_PENNA|nr:hypothetical protein PENNAL_c0037G09168 [Penicillium nalgiovense]
MARAGAANAGRRQGGRGQVQKKPRTCHYCYQRGHTLANCPTVMAIQGL